MLLPHRKYYQHYVKSTQADTHEIVRIYCCPCCGYPTIGEPGGYEICEVCHWEDDNGDDGGPNGDYSLQEAQENFKQYLTMYRASEEGGPQLKEHGYKSLHDFELRPAALERKKNLIASLKEYMAEPDPYRRGEIWEKHPHC